MPPIDKPEGAGANEKVSLDSAAGHLLEECRMVLPGIQALFGFQLIAVFNAGFSDKLSRPEQVMHLAALLVVALAAALVMTPAAVHRQSQQRRVSERFIWLSSAFLVASMYPLAAGVCLDIYLIARIVLESKPAAAAIAAAVLLIFLGLWIAVPRREAGREA
jgi:hypothetical protein